MKNVFEKGIFLSQIPCFSRKKFAKTLAQPPATCKEVFKIFFYFDFLILLNLVKYSHGWMIRTWASITKLGGGNNSLFFRQNNWDFFLLNVKLCKIANSYMRFPSRDPWGFYFPNTCLQTKVGYSSSNHNCWDYINGGDGCYSCLNGALVWSWEFIIC